MHDFQFERFLTISKIDDDQRMVYGYASTKDMDSDGEIITLDALKEAMPSYMQYPALREMHTANAAGTTRSAEIDKNGMYIGAEVVDDNAWKKVKKGVYKGFSVGGNVTQRQGNIITGLDLIEVSLVDSPANKAAKIDLWKRQFTDAQRQAAANSGVAMPDGSFPIKTEQDLRNAIHAIGRAKDPSAAKAHIKERARALGLSNLIPSSWGKAAYNNFDEIPSDELAAMKLEALKKMDFSSNKTAELLQKGMVIAMSEEVKKVDEVKDAGVETKTEEKTETEVKVDEKPAEEKTEESKEAADVADTLAKVQKASEIVAKIAPTKVEKTDSVVKAMNTMATAFAKMAGVLADVEERLRKVEETPAATKSKSAIVYKSQEDKDEKDEKSVDPTSPLGIAKARYAELEKKFDELGANEFAKKGFSKEAGQLQIKIAALSKAQ